MSTRAQALADQFEQANAAVIAAVEGLSEAQRRTTLGSDPRTVGVVAYHVAAGHAAIGQLVTAAASGQLGDVPTDEQIDAGNAQEAVGHAKCTKEETLALLRSNGTAAASLVRGLRDEQLDRAAGRFGTTETLITYVLIGHMHDHLNGIKAAAGPASPA